MKVDLNTPDGMRVAKVWTRAVLDLIKDGGVWAIPETETALQINKTTKTYVRTGPIHASVARVMQEIGWREEGPNG